jgi:DNA polymerase
MDRDRDPGAFDLSCIGFVDFETRGQTPIEAGATRYALDADAIICSYAIGDGPIQIAARSDFSRPLLWSDMPAGFRAHSEAVARGAGIWAAWNAGFDKAIWNFSTIGWPTLEAPQIIDVMAQAVASGFPPDLHMAAVMSGSHHKDKEGSRLIKLFCAPGAQATPQSHPEDWARFCSYAGDDIAAMRSIFKGTRQLSLADWREYWAMEQINERGAVIDLTMVEHAARLAVEDKARSKYEIGSLTGGKVGSVDKIDAMKKWLWDSFDGVGQDLLIKRAEELNDDGSIETPAKLTLTRGRLLRLIAYCEDTIGRTADAAVLDRYQRALRVLQIRLYGGSKTPAKFGRMLQQHVDRRLYGQYVFNGAAQTGRASSRGVQVHNLARDTMKNERELLDAIGAGADYDTIARLGPDPVSRKLSLLIRPAFVPCDEDHVFVWSDWSQIEARILPWSAGDDPGALDRLDIFRAVDLDPSVPDLYTRTTADISHIAIKDVTKPLRQRGKVAELALGFGGGVGALQAMGAAYGLHVDDAEARTIVDRWRSANPWCVNFWGRHDGHGSTGLWGAANRALEQRDPKKQYWAGRIHFRFHPTYFGGSLLCVLPSGRCLVYRAIRYEPVEDLDEDGEPTGHVSRKLRFARGYGRSKLWHGTFCENVVQAIAADCLRGTLVRLQNENFKVRLHTHDEVLLEVRREHAEITRSLLREVMQRGFSWSAGLPIMSDETVAYYYTKSEKDHGL